MTTPTELPATPVGAIAIMRPARRIDGCAYGLGQPALVVRLAMPMVADVSVGPATHLISQGLDLAPRLSQAHPTLELLQLVLCSAVALQVKAWQPVFDQGLAFAQTDGVYAAVLPCLTHTSGLLAMEGAVMLVNQALALADRSNDALASAYQERVTGLVDELAKFAPQGFNTLHFLRAAHELGAPWNRVYGHVFQVGWGSRSRWLMSSYTDATPNISAGLARDKLQTAAMLRAGGLPVPRHAAAQNEDDAIRLAQDLGYPVVVKPANLDGGVGVAARLEAPEAVRAAYAAARRHSNRVLVEKHIEGRDYRLHVVGDEVLGVLERVPGCVTGDGVHSVRGQARIT